MMTKDALDRDLRAPEPREFRRERFGDQGDHPVAEGVHLLGGDRFRLFRQQAQAAADQSPAGDAPATT